MDKLWRRFADGLPGFRTAVWWKKLVAISAYSVIGAVTIVGITSGYWSGTFWGLFLLAAALLAGNAWGIRERVPGFGSRSRRDVAIAWVAFVVVGLVIVGALSSTVDAERNAAAAAARATRATATPLAASPTPISAPAVAAPSQTPSLAATAASTSHTDADPYRRTNPGTDADPYRRTNPSTDADTGSHADAARAGESISDGGASSRVHRWSDCR